MQPFASGITHRFASHSVALPNAYFPDSKIPMNELFIASSAI